MNFEEMMQKIVNAEAKSGLRSSIMVQDSDIRCPRGHRPFNNTASKIQIQGTTAKNSYREKPKVKAVKPTLSKTAKASEPLKQARKEKKKKRHLERQDKKE